MYIVIKNLPDLIFLNAMIFTRISAAIMTMPVIGSRLIPVKIKLIVCLAITFLVSSGNLVPMQIEPLHVSYMVMSLFYQIMVGMVFGMIVQIIFQSFAMAGHIIAMQMGLGFAQMVDPQNGVSVPAVGQFYMMMVTLLFFVMNGHLYVVTSLVDSFKILPLYLLEFANIDTMMLTNLGSVIFSNALKIALPAILALLIANITFGVMTKASPQINIFSIGFSITLIIGIAVLYLTIIYIFPLFTDISENMQLSLNEVIGR